MFILVLELGESYVYLNGLKFQRGFTCIDNSLQIQELYYDEQKGEMPIFISIELNIGATNIQIV